MPPKPSDDQGENPDKLNFSKTQLTVIVGSIAAIVVLALALGFLTKKDDAKLEQQTKVEAPPAEKATEMPPLPDGAKKEELSKLEGSLPKQVPQTPDEELKRKTENKAGSEPQKPSETVAVPAPAAPQKAAPQKAPALAAPAPSPGTIVEKTASKPASVIKEKSPTPEKGKKAKSRKPKKKRIRAIHRKMQKPLKKHVDVQKKVKAASRRVAVKPGNEPEKTLESPIKDAETGKLENKPGALSFRTELKADALPSEPVTVEPPPAAEPKVVEAKAAEPKAVEPKAAEPSADEPKFTLLAETVASEADAKSRVLALKKNGHPAYFLKMVTTKNTWYRVLSGAYATQEEADAAAAEFGRKEHTTAKVLPYQKP